MNERAPSPVTFALTGVGGLRLHAQMWDAVGPVRAIVALAHGKSEHAGRYAHVVRALTSHGYAVYTVDHRGHGRSEGERGVIGRFDDYVDDFGLLVRHATRETPGAPLVVVGHSMGGLIAARYALAQQEEIAALVLSGPAFKIDEGMPGWRRSLLMFLGRVAPGLAAPPTAVGVLARDPEIERQFAADPLNVNTPTRLGFVRALLLAGEDAQRRFAELRLPMLLMHGAEDKLTSPRATEALHDQAPSADKTLKLWPENRHEIFNDYEKDAVIAEMLAWLDARFPPLATG